MLQTRQAIRRNFPLIGHARYLLEAIRPGDQPVLRRVEHRRARPSAASSARVVYQRAKNVIDTLPFGTERDVYESGYEWINHSIRAQHPVGPLAARDDRRHDLRPAVPALRC